MKGAYTLIGNWPSGTVTSHVGSDLLQLRILASNWSRAGASCRIVLGHDVVERWKDGEVT